MMHFLIAPDFPPELIAGWHLLNTYLQRKCDCQMHLYIPHSSQEQYDILRQGKIDLIFANPFDAAKLVRHVGYLPAVRPKGVSNEMVIATSAESAIKKIDDIQPKMKVALTKNYDIRLVGLRLLEPADVTEQDLEWVVMPSYQSVARAVITKEVDVGFFVKGSFDSLNRLTKAKIHTVIESHLRDISHMLLIHPRNKDTSLPEFQKVMIDMTSDPNGSSILKEIGMPNGFEILTREDCEFLIDLMDTLLD